MTVIPMGVDLKRRFIPPPVRDSAMSLLFVGRLEEKKGLRYLLNAMASVVREFPEAHLTIVGEGSKSDEFKGLASSLGLTEKTTFVGALSNPELPPLFQRSNIFVFPDDRPRRLWYCARGSHGMRLCRSNNRLSCP